MKRNQNNNISFGDYDNKGSRKLLPLLLIVLILLAVAAGGYFGYKFVSERRNAVESIAITQLPKYMAFLVGADADFSGLEITATRKNGKTFAFFNTHLGFGEENQIKSVPLLNRIVNV